MESQSVYEHGESVRNHLFDLLDHLRSGSSLKYEWKLPQWLYDNKDKILNSLPSDYILSNYTLYHDCGKPFCFYKDESGRNHFPDHVRISYDVYKKVFNVGVDDVVSYLILHDMDIHLLKSAGVEEFSKLPYNLTLILVGLAEIHSNSKLFGGLESTSFKIKWKNIDQRTKKLFKLL